MARLNSKIFPALTEDIIANLQSRNIFTVYDFMKLEVCDLTRKTGLSFKEIESIRESIFKSFGGEIIGNPADLCEREIQDVITTGIKNLDTLLKGGLQCHKIYEFCGFSSSGKSQLCHWISMCATLNASTEVHYVDASKNFCASRIQMMLEAKQSTDTVRILGEVMSGIRVYQIHQIQELFSVLYRLSNLPKSDSSKKLVIIDSLSVLCAIIPNTELTPILCNLASVCRFLVNHFRAAIVIVNTVRLQKGGDNLFAQSDITANAKLKPSLGNYWLGVPNVRLLITQLENKSREISVWKSDPLEDGKKCFVTIKDEGILSSS